MADTIGEFLVKISSVFDDQGISDAKVAVEQALDPFEAFKDVVGEIGLVFSAGAAIWKLVDWSEESLQYMGDLEQSSMRLGMALKNLGVFTESGFADLRDYADEMERKSSFDKIAIQDAQALLTTFGLYGDKLKEVTQGAMDLAVARNMDLNSAVMLLGRAYDGNTQMLKRYGITIDETGTTSQKFEQVMKLVQERFGGAAAAQVDTYNGKISQMEHAFDGLKQQIGEQLKPVAEWWIDWVGRAATATSKLIQPQEDVAKGRQLTIASLKTEQEQLVASIASLSTHGGALVRESQQYKDLEAQLNKVEAAIKREQAALAAEPAAKAGKPRFGQGSDDANKMNAEQQKWLREFADSQQKEYATKQETLDKEYQEFVSSKQDELAVEAENLAQRLEMEGRHEDALEVLDTARVKASKLKNKELKEDARDTFGFIAQMQTAKTKELMIIGKTAAMAEATINTQVAFTKTLAAFPAPVNYALAAAVLAAGMAHVAQIAGVQLAEGGVVSARPGGIQATIGEGGEAEAVAPLSKLQGMIESAVARAGGGGSGQINFTQNVTIQGAGGTDDVPALMDKMRIATRDGLAEAIDAVKQFRVTAEARANEA